MGGDGDNRNRNISQFCTCDIGNTPPLGKTRFELPLSQGAPRLADSQSFRVSVPALSTAHHWGVADDVRENERKSPALQFPSCSLFLGLQVARLTAPLPLDGRGTSTL
jgi:hypothetical protein